MFYKKEPILERQQIFRTTKNFNIWSLEKCASNYIFVKLQRHKIYCSFHLKWRLVPVKHQQFYLFFTQIVITGQIILSINKDLFPHGSLHNIVYDLKTTFL